MNQKNPHLKGDHIMMMVMKKVKIVETVVNLDMNLKLKVSFLGKLKKNKKLRNKNTKNIHKCKDPLVMNQENLDMYQNNMVFHLEGEKIYKIKETSSINKEEISKKNTTK